ncbi:hypothetical protein [Rhizobium binxianense]|uniref:hypothetical protein n=1 Tax=Rhizobium binxianense TaxID=3024242 RepID=UPI0023A9D434|nr:hypothetical protein [Rhizobium sp. MJ22]WEA23843.1 hypothetical protein PO862_12000 [Rhizobium sp. MJ22]
MTGRRLEAVQGAFGHQKAPHLHAGLALMDGPDCGSAYNGSAEPLYPFVFTQFRTENRFALFLKLL